MTEAEALIRDLAIRPIRKRAEGSMRPVPRPSPRRALVARAIARKTGSQVGLNLSTQLEMNTFFVLDREPGAPREARPRPDPEVAQAPIREPKPAAVAAPTPQPAAAPKPAAVPTPQPFRIQFVGATTESGPTILREDEIRASDVSAAIIAAAIASWPPKTIGLRILDHDGHEVFGRRRTLNAPGCGVF